MDPEQEGCVQESQERIGYVYFIWARSVNRIKIGYAGYDPDYRFSELNVGSPVPLEKYALLRGPQSLERELHRRFKKYRKKGEWFRAHDSLVQFIDRDARNWKELLDEERAADDVRSAAKREESNRKMREQYKRINAHQTYCQLLGLDPMETPMGEAERRYDEMRKRRNKPPKPRRYGPLQTLLDQLAADKDPAP